MMKKTDKYQKILNAFFSRIGVEVAPADFTVNVMNKLGLETGIEPIKTRPAVPKYLTVIPVAAMFISIPFGNHIINYTNRFLYIVSNFDYGFISRFFTSLIETIGSYSVTSTGLIILSVSLIFFCTMIIINIQDYFYKTQTVNL